MNARIIDMSDEEYFASPALDQSQLKKFNANPAQWGFERLNGSRPPMPAMRFGTAFHAYLLGTADVVSLSEAFDDPDMSFRCNAAKEWREEQETMGNIVVSDADKELLDRMKSNFVADRPDMYEILQAGVKEQAIFWTDKKTGLELKAKPDLIPIGTDYIVDLKTASSASPERFHREAIDYGYHVQALFYRMAVAQCPAHMFDRTRKMPGAMQFWVFEKSGACDWRPYSLSADNPVMGAAKTAVKQALYGIAEMAQLAEQEGLGEGVDGAARYAMRHGYSKDVEEIEFTDYDVYDAEVKATFNG